MSDATTRQRAIGALVGLVGTTLEFNRPGSFEPVDDMVGGGPFGLRPGQWTGDTSMAMCLAESILDTGYLDPPTSSAATSPGVATGTGRRPASASTSA